MTKLSRKIKRKKMQRIEKDARNQLRKVEKSIDELPTECSFCNATFANEDTDKWTIKIDLSGATMKCPKCQESSNENQN
jgi:transcription elongation factor Elf1